MLFSASVPMFTRTYYVQILLWESVDRRRMSLRTLPADLNHPSGIFPAKNWDITNFLVADIGRAILEFWYYRCNSNKIFSNDKIWELD